MSDVERDWAAEVAALEAEVKRLRDNLDGIRLIAHFWWKGPTTAATAGRLIASIEQGVAEALNP
jgi:hypothetical protein